MVVNGVKDTYVAVLVEDDTTRYFAFQSQRDSCDR